MTAYLAPQFDTQFFDGSTVAAGYKLYTYDSGTTTPKAVYSDQAGTVPHTNPIVLDANGRVTGQMFLGSGEYTFTLKTDADVLVKTWNDVAGSETVNDAAALDSALRADLASTSDVSKGSGMEGHNATLGYAAGTVGAAINDGQINAMWFPWLAKCDGVTDDTAAIQAAITFALTTKHKTVVVPGDTVLSSSAGASALDLGNTQFVNLVFEGNVNAANLGAGGCIVEFNGESFCTVECKKQILGNVSLAADAFKFTYGTNNRVILNSLQRFRYGLVFTNDGGGTKSKVENRIWYNDIGYCKKGVYFMAPAGTTDAVEGVELWGGFIHGCSEHGVLIGAGVDAQYGFITGAIDGFGVGKDWENLSDTGFNMYLKFMQNTAYYTLSSCDMLFNSQVTGVTLQGPPTGGFPALSVVQAVPFALAASQGNIGSYFNAGDTKDGTTRQGVIVGNTRSFSPSSSVAAFIGYISNATASAGSRVVLGGIHRNSDDTGVAQGASVHLVRRAGGNSSDVEVYNGSTLIGKFYAEGDRLNLPVTKTPASSADASGSTGDITADANYVYVKTSVGWKRASLTAF